MMKKIIFFLLLSINFSIQGMEYGEKNKDRNLPYPEVEIIDGEVNRGQPDIINNEKAVIEINSWIQKEEGLNGHSHGLLSILMPPKSCRDYYVNLIAQLYVKNIKEKEGKIYSLTNELESVIKKINVIESHNSQLTENIYDLNLKLRNQEKKNIELKDFIERSKDYVIKLQNSYENKISNDNSENSENKFREATNEIENIYRAEYKKHKDIIKRYEKELKEKDEKIRNLERIQVGSFCREPISTPLSTELIQKKVDRYEKNIRKLAINLSERLGYNFNTEEDIEDSLGYINDFLIEKFSRQLNNK